MESPTFNGYKPLDRTKKEIRVVTLKGITDNIESSSQLLTCTLEHVALDDANPFYALSYVWGSPDETKTISIDGQPVQIRENLWQFLQQLCQGFSELRVWLDYISINQQDLEERNFQVSMMDQIYRSADSVYAWIGASTKASDEFFKPTTANRNRRRRPSDGLDSCKSQLVVYKDMAARAYWTRLWIVQAFVLARNLWLFCGSGVTNWKDFESMISSLENAVRLSGIKHGSDEGYIRWLLSSRTSAQAGSLSNLVERFSSSKCQDSRDRIFGLLSLVDKSEAHLVTVDYSKPLLQLLLDTCELWSQDLANDLVRGKSPQKPTDSDIHIEWSSVSKFCNAILKMMKFEDLELLQKSASMRQTVKTKCVFSSSTPPRRIDKSCTLAAVRWNGTLEPDSTLISPDEMSGYVSVLKEDAGSSDWLFAFTCAPFAKGDLFVTIGDNTLLIFREDEIQQPNLSVRTISSVHLSMLATGILIEPPQSTSYTRTLRLPQPQFIFSQLLPDADYDLLSPTIATMKGREAQTRLRVLVNTAALVMLLVAHQRTTDQQAKQVISQNGTFVDPAIEVEGTQDLSTWSPWSFGLEHHLLRPCLRCKLMGSRAEGRPPMGTHGINPCTPVRCECEWVAKVSRQEAGSLPS